MNSSISNVRKSRGRPKVGATALTVRMPPDELALLDRFIAERQPGMTRPEALRFGFREWTERGLERTPGTTEAEMIASAVDVRSQAADAADEAMSGMEATKQEKASRRGALTDEPAVVEAARSKNRGQKNSQ